MESTEDVLEIAADDSSIEDEGPTPVRRRHRRTKCQHGRWGLRKSKQLPLYEIFHLDQLDPRSLNGRFLLYSSSTFPNYVLYELHYPKITEKTYLEYMPSNAAVSDRYVANEFTVFREFRDRELVDRNPDAVARKLVLYCNLYSYLKKKSVLRDLETYQLTYVAPTTFSAIVEEENTVVRGHFPSEHYGSRCSWKDELMTTFRFYYPVP